MSDESIKAAARAAMEAEKVRRLKEAEAEIDRAVADDWAALERITAKYNLRVIAAGDDPQNIFQGVASTPIEEIIIPHHGGNPNLTKRVQTLGELVSLYLTDERSPYHALRYQVRATYDSLINRIIAEHGETRLSDLNAEAIQRMYKGWAAGNKIAMGHAVATRLRGLFSFGTTTLDDAGCQRLSLIMNKMRFPNAAARTEVLTLEMVEAIRAKAHELKKPSIALAQAFQFEVMLRQKDVVGEWIPASEPGESDIVFDGLKWLGGLRWEEMDNNLVLRHVMSFHQRLEVIDLSRKQMVLEEFQKLPDGILKKGPIIRAEFNGRAWSTNEYRRWWRKIADAAGVPKEIKNMDSRPLESRSVTTQNALDTAAKQSEKKMEDQQERLIH
jgi:hypothetical protein